jgi:uncharacterized phage-associated protein
MAKPLQIDSLLFSTYLLARIGQMSHLKLQKLLYYEQAFHLVVFEEPLITDDFQAWMHGPVSPKVWQNFKSEGSPLHNVLSVSSKRVRKIKSRTERVLLPDQIDLINDVIAEYGDKSAYHLECLTHSESPWIDARKGIAADASCRNVISKKSILRFYRKWVYGSSTEAEAKRP